LRQALLYVMMVTPSHQQQEPWMACISAALDRVKSNPLFALDRRTIEQLCIEHGYEWRDRELDPATTVALFLQQVAHGNVSCCEARRVTGTSASVQAYCKARGRLPLAVYQALLAAVVEAVVPLTRRSEHLWHGHRTLHVDGSSISMPDTPELQKAFGMPSGQKEGCGFPSAHLMVLFSAPTGLLLETWMSPLRTGDVAQMSDAHGHLCSGDIVIGDDTYGGYAHLAALDKSGLHGLFPTHHLRIVDFTKGRPHTVSGTNAVAGLPRSRWIKSLGREDQLVEYFKTKARPRYMSKEEYDALPASIIVRELRRTVRRPVLGKITLTMVTTLIDPVAYPAADLLELRLQRWDVETNLGHLKTTMKMDVLRCQSEDGVRKEMAVFGLVYNLVRCVMLEAARRQEVPVRRISFADALYWMRYARPNEAMPALKVNKDRPGRQEPRCRKRRPKQYDLMNKPRAEMKKALKNKGKTG
jgi:hypothetical protein